MITHTDNRHYGTSIVDSTITVDTINQVDGINPASILSFLPTVHDISDQCDGTNTVFNLSPPMAQGTQNLCLVFLDGQLLSKASVITEPDFFISGNLQQITFFTDITHLPPPQGSQLLVVYVEDNNPI
jgi:hypothetical protein